MDMQTALFDGAEEEAGTPLRGLPLAIILSFFFWLAIGFALVTMLG